MMNKQGGSFTYDPCRQGLTDIAWLITGLDKDKAVWMQPQDIVKVILKKLYYISCLTDYVQEPRVMVSDEFENDILKTFSEMGYTIPKEQLTKLRADAEEVALDITIQKKTETLFKQLLKEDTKPTKEPEGMVDGRPYPLTIALDRYSGVYSGGLYVAWNCDPESVPTEPSDDDVTCADFWAGAWGDMLRNDIPCYGVGVTPDRAILALIDNMVKKKDY